MSFWVNFRNYKWIPAILRNALAFENTWIPLATKDGSTTSATLFGSAEKAISTSVYRS